MRVFLMTALVIFSAEAFSWSGIDKRSGTKIEIDSGNRPEKGVTIEVHDYQDGTYHDVEIKSIITKNKVLELRVYDLNTDKERIFDMVPQGRLDK